MALNGIAIIFVIANVFALLFLPRRWAPMPLLIGACYMTLNSGIEIGPTHFSIIRILVAAGLLRVMMRGERLAGGMNGLDRIMLIWSAWALLSSTFHKDPSAALMFRLGLVYNAGGIYFLIRIFCQSLDDVAALCRITAVLMVPLAIEMLFENGTSHNLFSILGGVSETPAIREGKVRAQGPFAHAILAGTAGAVTLPIIIGIWSKHRMNAVIGVLACVSIVLTSASSGPMMSAMAAVIALFMWHYRGQMRFVRWMAVLIYIGLDLFMKAPVYYLIARIDLTGGSTGYHRAALIESSLRHFDEWWFAGTDYTRHWMPTGVSWSQEHTDITNHYLNMGVVGGLPLMFLFIIVLAKGFSLVGRTLQMSELSQHHQYMCWALGASLFAHATTFLAVSYFDQSFVFIYLTLAAIGSVWSATVPFETIHATADNEQPITEPVDRLSIVR